MDEREWRRRRRWVVVICGFALLHAGALVWLVVGPYWPPFGP